MPSPSDSLNLTSCDKEQVHLIGGIQTHGFFLAFRLRDKTIYHASANLESLLRKSAGQLIGTRLDEALPPALSKAILAVAAELKGDDFETFTVRDLHADVPLAEVRLYDWDGLIAAEIEPLAEVLATDLAKSSHTAKYHQAFVEDLQKCSSVPAAAKLLCRSVRNLIGFDRVMMYRYLPSWDGEVIAEDKSAEAHTFLHHRFPATDIPLPARELYLKNRTRMISDSGTGAAAIIPNIHYLTRKPLDLSRSKLRAVSPVHLEYLKNMGVTASFSVAVIVDGSLWGLIACHKKDAAIIPHDFRRACDTLASVFAMVANMLEDLTAKSQRIAFEEKIRALFQKVRISAEPLKHLFESHRQLEELFTATGIAMATNRKVEIAGLTPTQEQTTALATWLRRRFKEEDTSVLAFDNLSEADARWTGISELVCGAIAIFSPENDEAVFLIFRPGLLRTVTWGGDPRKTMEKRKYQGQINPRVSFESWTETVSLNSARWEPFELKGAEFLRDFVFDCLIRKERLIQELGAKLNFDR